jgi:hypothetical protein
MSEWCCWWDCRDPRTPRGTIPLCDRHILIVYSTVVNENLQAQRPLPEPLPPKPAPKTIQELIPPRKPEPRPGWVYYVRIGEHIKIGHATNLWNRMRAYPPSAELLATESGDQRLEKARHSEFRAFLDAGREWFRPAPELMAHIEKLGRDPGPPLDVWAHRANRPPPVSVRGWSGHVRKV